jgi:hypothetical protein
MNETIEQRNARVKTDKAWEVSKTRRVIIALGTYIAAGLYLGFLNVGQAWLHALVPPCAYLLSTMTLPIFKKFWLKRIYKKP